MGGRHDGMMGWMGTRPGGVSFVRWWCKEGLGQGGPGGRWLPRWLGEARESIDWNGMEL